MSKDSKTENLSEQAQAVEPAGADDLPPALRALLDAVVSKLDQRLQEIERKIDEQGRSIGLLKANGPSTLLEELRAEPRSAIREEIVARREIEAKRTLRLKPWASSMSTPAAGRLDGSDSRKVPQGTYLGNGTDDD